MPRYRLILEYDGTPYAGWQSQAAGEGVQDALERAILGLTGERRRLLCAGRTDAGVHATHQVVSFDLAREWRTDTLRDGLNAYLTQGDELVAVLSAHPAPDTFSARMMARRRHYLYRIVNRRPPSPLERLSAWHVSPALDAAAMHAAAQHLVGHHDFSTFRAANCQAKTPMRTLERLDVTWRAAPQIGTIIEVRASARSFLHNQVRSMVGSLKKVGTGHWSADDLVAALEARDRARCGPVAPAHGLTFIGVDYDAEDLALQPAK
jgi:tRNA pseudouridine38-40 synthase